MNWINSWGEVEQIYDTYQDHRVRSVTKTFKEYVFSMESVNTFCIPASCRKLLEMS